MIGSNEAFTRSITVCASSRSSYIASASMPAPLLHTGFQLRDDALPPTAVLAVLLHVPAPPGSLAGMGG
jgi:hypothetical protein